MNGIPSCSIGWIGIGLVSSLHAADRPPLPEHDGSLRCLGIDHTKLTFRFQGRDFRLTDVEGHVVQGLLA